jgi:hypothetical protein
MLISIYKTIFTLSCTLDILDFKELKNIQRIEQNENLALFGIHVFLKRKYYKTAVFSCLGTKYFSSGKRGSDLSFSKVQN